MIRRTKDREGIIMRSLERPSKPVKVNMRAILEKHFGPGFSNRFTVSGNKLRYKDQRFWGFKEPIHEHAQNLASQVRETGIDCKVTGVKEKHPPGKATEYAIMFEIAPTQELEDRVRDDPRINESLSKRYDREAAERAAKPKPKESLRGERRVVNPGTTPGRFTSNNRLGWSKEQFDSFLVHSKPGTTFRSLIKDLSKGKINSIVYWPGNSGAFTRMFESEHPYPGIVRLIKQIDQLIQFSNTPEGGRKVEEVAKQLEKRIEVLWNAARTERRLKSMIMAKVRKSLGLR